MDELITWLRVQLDDDERDADHVHDQDACDNAIARGHDACTCRWPKLIRDEIEAKRAILDEHRHYPVGSGFGCGICSIDGHMNCETDEGWCTTVRLLAQPYAGRNGWRAEWELDAGQII